MEIHNLMEDLVKKVVTSIQNDERDQSAYGYCISDDCCRDVICYVLNRISPRYVTSGRGLAHANVDLGDDRQVEVDIVALANEGFKRVSSTRRDYYDTGETTNVAEPNTAANGLSFPAARGRILHGMTFEPMTRGEVALFRAGELVPMIDGRWQNPVPLTSAAPGTYIFLPASISADDTHQGMQRPALYEFEVVAEAPGFEPLHHFFSLEAYTQHGDAKDYRMTLDFCLRDLYILPS